MDPAERAGIVREIPQMPEWLMHLQSDGWKIFAVQ